MLEGDVMATLLTRVRMLDLEECRDLASDITALRVHWDRLSEECGRYKLGAAAFIEGKLGAQEYVTASKEKNRLLDFHFWPLYEQLSIVLSRHLGAPVLYAEGFAKPGFHILIAKENTRAVNGDRHRDEQHKFLPWQVRPSDGHSSVCSFTLPIALPNSGGGLLTWPDGEEGAGEYHPYSPGEMVIHSGDILHQAVAIQEGVPEFQPDDQRITLQGHGLLLETGVWALYL
jgi:hypothetical protein